MDFQSGMAVKAAGTAWDELRSQRITQSQCQGLEGTAKDPRTGM